MVDERTSSRVGDRRWCRARRRGHGGHGEGLFREDRHVGGMCMGDELDGVQRGDVFFEVSRQDAGWMFGLKVNEVGGICRWRVYRTAANGHVLALSSSGQKISQPSTESVPELAPKRSCSPSASPLKLHPET